MMPEAISKQKAFVVLVRILYRQLGWWLLYTRWSNEAGTGKGDFRLLFFLGVDDTLSRSFSNFEQDIEESLYISGKTRTVLP